MSLGEDIVNQYHRIDRSRDASELFERAFKVMKDNPQIEAFKSFVADIHPDRTFFLSKQEMKDSILESDSSEVPLIKESITICDGFGFVCLSSVQGYNESTSVIVAMIYISPPEDEVDQSVDDIFVPVAIGMRYHPDQEEDAQYKEANARGFTKPLKIDAIFCDRETGDVRHVPLGGFLEKLLVADVANNISSALDQFAYLQKKSGHSFFEDLEIKKLANARKIS